MYLDIQQNTPEWLDMRSGKVTGSAIAKVMANGTGAFGEPAKKLAINIAVERITGQRITTNDYKNTHMERGHEEEPIARELYEDKYFVEVTNGGFYNNGRMGCSPDGLVGEDGLIEIKSVIATTHYANVERGTIDPAYKWQCYFNLNESGRDWIDFVSYCSSYPETTNLYVFRIYKTDIAEELETMERRLADFEKLVEEKANNISGKTSQNKLNGVI